MAKKTSLDDIVSSAKSSFSNSVSIGVEIPNLVQEGSSRNDALVYTVIKEIQSEGGQGVTYRKFSNVSYALPAPIDIIDLHSANWEGVAFGAQKRLLQSITPFTTVPGLAARQVGTTAIALAANQQNQAMALGLEDTANLLAGAKGEAINPNTEMLFRSPKLRQMQLQYRIAILNRQDANSLKSFIDKIRTNMYPRGGLFYTGYPAIYSVEVRISSKTTSSSLWSDKPLFSMKGNARSLFDRRGCALTDLQISYGDQGMYAGHYDGSPGIVNLNLTFQELSLSDRESIESEYSR